MTRTEIAELLAADSTLMAILTGGVHAAREITRQGTPTAFDVNLELLPCALVKTPTEAAFGPYDDSASEFAHIYLYERSGFASIDAALERIYTLLHQQKISGERVWEIIWANDIKDQEDPALDASMHMSIYQVVRAKG